MVSARRMLSEGVGKPVNILNINLLARLAAPKSYYAHIE